MPITTSLNVNLAGRAAFITGGGGILCSRMAQVLAANGASVAIADLRADVAEKAAAEVRAHGGRAIPVACNVTDNASLAAALKATEEAFGRVDILVNGAGGNAPRGTTGKEICEPADLQDAARRDLTFFGLDPAAIGSVFDLNFLGTLRPCQVFAEHMAQRGGGVIINVASMNAYRPLTKIPAYSAAKAAVVNFTQWLAVHLAPCGIRVNAIAPGFFITQQNYALLKKADGGLTPRGDTILSHTPQRRFGTPEDLDGALLWLVSEGASFVTGAIIPVDGGFSAFSGV